MSEYYGHPGRKECWEVDDRIAELEAELRTECVHCGQPIPHVHKHESTRELALRLRAEKAEAEVDRLKAHVEYDHNLLDDHSIPHGKFKGGGRESDTSGEASPTRVASPPHDDTNAALELARFLSEQGVESVLTPRFKLAGKPVTVAAAEPAAPSLSARKATPRTGHYADCICVECEAARKERDEG